MSPRKSDAPKASAPAKPDVYVALLLVSLASLLGGCIFLFMEMDKYDWTIAK